MRLIYITVSLPYSNGEAFVEAELHQLRALGHDVLVVPRSPPREDNRLGHCGIVSVREPIISSRVVGAFVRELRKRPRRTVRLVGHLLSCGHMYHGMKNALVLAKGFWLAEVAREWKAQHLHAHWCSTTATMAMVASWVSGIPWSCTAHRGDIVEANCLQLKLREAAFFRFISRSGIRLAQERVRDLGERHVLLPMGVRIPHDDVLAASTFPMGPAVVLCPGRLVPIKGHKYLLHAVSRLLKQGVVVRLLLAGDGELKSSLEREAAKLGITSITSFLGHVPQTTLEELYRRRKVTMVVLPSLDLGQGNQEGIPVALMEAMAFGIPVVAASTGGIPELIKQSGGILVPPANSNAIADAIASLARDREECARVGSIGRRIVAHEFNIEIVIRQLVNLFSRSAQPMHESDLRNTL